jgi:hypothetical protein
MDAIEAKMEELRGLEETSPITRSLLTSEGLATFMQRELHEEYPAREVETDIRVLAALDFVPRDYDLLGFLIDLYSAEVVGLYDDEVDTLYVIDDAVQIDAGDFDILARVTYAHEYVHGLQDEHFDLDAFADNEALNDDQFLARLSLVEGDASLAMNRYLFDQLDFLSDEDLELLEGEPADDPVESAPSIIRETFDFPYTYGLDFVAVLQQGGWEAVDAAFADPPQSTEQILHPEKYFSRDEPQIVSLPPLTDTLGIGWRHIDTETLGEFQTAVYLAQQIDRAAADIAAQGWGGDQYALYARDGDDLMVYHSVWDSPEDRGEFAAAYTRYLEAKYSQLSTDTTGGERWWETPAQTAVLAWEDDSVLIVLGPDRITVEKALSALR